MSDNNTETLIAFVTEGFEAIRAIQDAKQNDGKIRFFEWIGIVGEFKDVIKILPELKDTGKDFQDSSAYELTKLAEAIMVEVESIRNKPEENRKFNFTTEDVLDLLFILRSGVRIITRNVGS